MLFYTNSTVFLNVYLQNGTVRAKTGYWIDKPFGARIKFHTLFAKTISTVLSYGLLHIGHFTATNGKMVIMFCHGWDKEPLNLF